MQTNYKIGDIYTFPRINERIYIPCNMTTEEADALYKIARHCGSFIYYADLYIVQKVGRTKLYLKEIEFSNYSYEGKEKDVAIALKRFCSKDFGVYIGKDGDQHQNFNIDDKKFGRNPKDIQMHQFESLIETGWLRKWGDSTEFLHALESYPNNEWTDYRDFPWPEAA